MPTPPFIPNIKVISIGVHMPGAIYRLYTWGQVRTSVYFEGPFLGDAFEENVNHSYEYIPDMTGGPWVGITAVESGNRLFRGSPMACSGFNINVYPDPMPDPPVAEEQYFRIANTLDFTERPLLLLDSVWTGNQTITADSDSYSLLYPGGQEIAAEPNLGPVTTIDLAF